MEIIAELGSNWDTKDSVLAAVHEAAACGVTGFKIQLFRADKFYSKERAPRIHADLKNYEIPYEWLLDIKEACKTAGLSFWASAFDQQSLDIVAEYVDGLKIASGEIVNEELLRRACDQCESKKLPLAIADGAADADEIIHAMDIADGYLIPKLILMHCVSAYPAIPNEYDMRFIYGVRDIFDEIGVSDHTQSSIVAVLGVGLGCTYFEKHFRPTGLKRKTPDSGPHSATASELIMYTYDIKQAFAALGSDSEKHIHASEESERLWARRGSDGLRPKDSVHQ